jgi:glycosyltransferase involved in cell wall biosynthesis
MAKLLRPRIKLVFFLHLASPTHVLDRLFSWVMLGFCDMVWGDSRSTLCSRLKAYPALTSRVISFVTQRPTVSLPSNGLEPRFAFWGRLHQQKGLDRSINLIWLLREKGIEAMLEIWGPDDGERESLLRQVRESGLGDAVAFKGAAQRDQLDTIASGNSFFLQLSRVEGMAMAVVEGMQRSLVPVVTPVGEIENYCVNGSNAVVVDPNDLESAVSTLIQLLEDEKRYRAMQESARHYWENHILYRDDICIAAKELMKAK